MSDESKNGKAENAKPNKATLAQTARDQEQARKEAEAAELRETNARANEPHGMEFYGITAANCGRLNQVHAARDEYAEVPER